MDSSEVLWMGGGMMSVGLVERGVGKVVLTMGDGGDR